MTDLLLVGAGGFLGAVARYTLGGWVAGPPGPAFLTKPY